MLKPPPPVTVILPPSTLAVSAAEAEGDVIVLTADHARAEAVAALVRALVPGVVTALYPATDALPGDAVGASRANAGERVGALHALEARGKARAILVAPVAATIAPVAAPEAFAAAPPHFAVGDAIDVESFAATAEEIGYRADERVDEPGEYALRGGVIDIYPVDKGGAIRLTLADGAIAAIGCYDALTQRTIDTLDRIEIGRAREPDAPASATLLDHLPDAAVLIDADAEDRRETMLALWRDGTGQRAKADTVDAARWAKALSARERLEPGDALAPPPRFVERRDPARAFAKVARETLADGVLLLAGSERDLRFLAPRVAKRLKTTIARVDDWAAVRAAGPGALLALCAPLERGFMHVGVTVAAAADLLGGRAARDDLPSTPAELLTASEIRVGDLVVHEDHGIGRVLGLEALPEGGEGIRLEYARDGRRLVPLGEADRIWRYGADADGVPLDSLDGASWQKRRAAIDAAVAESAKALAKVAEERASRTTDPIEPDAAKYETFASGFAFTETPDQARAIAAVRDDLASGRPMDRLVVGDVGYGKTEVALRAAAMVAIARRQVALAAPTTVLARQHLDTFRKRFAGTDVVVEGLSRLTPPAEARRIRAGLADGSVHVVVGTGAVAGRGVAYHDLALAIIDEEQRFGAADKANLAGLGAGHLLMLSATPIPRTLQAALVGLQQLSVIATPPARRQPIRTIVETFDTATVKAALLREAGRGGQSFVVVPRIADIAPLEAVLREIVPDLGLVVAHGKMAAADLDEAMVGFAAGDGDVLLATNIIEAGLDVPRANTMIVHRADRFGLAQLHQLRGRVGRGGRRGQILLTTDGEGEIHPRTLARLRTLQAFDRLGAGFAISARDLDLRGAGDLLGEEQAGHMKLIGVDLYQHLLAHALRQARGQEADRTVPELKLGDPGHFPADWIPDEGLRLALYARLARIEDGGAVDAFEEELEDRFGALPDAAARLLDWVRARLLAAAAGVARVDAGPAAIALTPRDRKVDWSDAGLTAKDGRWIASVQSDDADRLEKVREVLAEVAG